MDRPAVMTLSPLPVTPKLGERVPSERHAISVQLPTWDDMVSLGCHDDRISVVQKGGYPRSFLHEDIIRLGEKCKRSVGDMQSVVFLFPAREHAQACLEYAETHASAKIDGDVKTCCIHTFDFHISSSAEKFELRIHAALLPVNLEHDAMRFWRLTGLGISSRLAERCLLLDMRHASLLSKYVQRAENPCASKSYSSAAHDQIRTALANLHNRGSDVSVITKPVNSEDVYLYQSGMAAIYHAHHLCLSFPGTTTVVFGFPYELTLKLVQTYSSACEFWGFGNEEELDQFESFLERGNRVRAVWCECASNPLLRTVDLSRIRHLADRYGFLVIIDDTIGSVANINILDIADIIVSSLTKSFSGYANVMAGSIILSPQSVHHATLYLFLNGKYQNHLYEKDAIQLEQNSRDFLWRSAKANQTASALAKKLKIWSCKPRSPIKSIYYPELCWSRENYVRHMRLPTSEYKTGFGSLLTIDFTDVESAAMFFNALPVHKGPSLGAQYTLIQPYVQTVFQAEKEWAARYGLRESIVRISIGLEDPASLLAAFESAAQSVYDYYSAQSRSCTSKL